MRTLVVGIAMGLALVGCNPMPGNPAENYTPPSESSFDEQIAKVKADPSMSENAKTQAIRGIETAKAMTHQGGKAAGRT
jgi:hypothetical protein